MLVPLLFPFMGLLGKTVRQNSQTFSIFSKQTRAKLSAPRQKEVSLYQVVKFKPIVLPAESASLCFYLNVSRVCLLGHEIQTVQPSSQALAGFVCSQGAQTQPS